MTIQEFIESQCIDTSAIAKPVAKRHKNICEIPLNRKITTDFPINLQGKF